MGVHFKSYMRILRICTQATACRPSAVQLSGAVDGVGGAVAWDGASAATAGGLRDAVASNGMKKPKKMVSKWMPPSPPNAVLNGFEWF